MENDTVLTEPDATASEPQVDREPSAEGALLVEQELLVEEISIDGMCGVY